ncbi:MAG: flavodoxin family protein [Pseudomonadota bacterium]|nr:flavodoxin family protein [Pseudomonadota bacterium]
MVEDQETRELLVIWHSRTGASEAMAHAAWRGASEEGNASIIAVEDAGPADFIRASAYLFVCPENLGSMSGATKEMFDRCYYPLLGQIEGRAYGSIIAAGSDGQGAQQQLDRIVKGWRLRRVTEPFIANFDAQTPEDILATKRVGDPVLAHCDAIGKSLAAGLGMGLY